MSRKIKPYIITCLSLLLAFTSCKTAEEEGIISTDAEVLSVTLSRYHYSYLASTVFSIDQRNGLIFNRDSLPYQTELPGKVKFEYVTSDGATKLKNTTDADNEYWVGTGDSLDVRQPIKFRLRAMDDVTWKEYTFKVNIHTVNPDTVLFNKVGDITFLQDPVAKYFQFKGSYYALAYEEPNRELKTFKSADMKTWDEIPSPTITGNIDYAVNHTQTSSKYVVINNESSLLVSEDMITWTSIPTSGNVEAIVGILDGSALQEEGVSVLENDNTQTVVSFYTQLFNEQGPTVVHNELPSTDFPTSGFNTISYTVMGTERLLVAGTSPSSSSKDNYTWSSEDGLNWVRLSRNTNNIQSQLTGYNLFPYNGELLVMNGFYASTSYEKTVYFSRDGGIVWQKKDADDFVFPSEFTNRSNASLVLDPEGIYFYIIGGERDGVRLNDIWQGMLVNRTF